LRLLKERDILQVIRAEELRKKVREGFAVIDRGDYREFSSTEDILARIMQDGRNRAAGNGVR
jgi:hypothetical protein